MKSNKKRLLRKLSPKEYQIYGIFDFDLKKLVYVNLDIEQTEFEFIFGQYDEERFDVVEFAVRLI